MRVKTENKTQAEKANITLKLDRELLKKMKILAATREMSISALVTMQLEKLVSESGESDVIRKRAIARMRKGFDLGFTPAKSRDELHER
jgi:hypothetical protein